MTDKLAEAIEYFSMIRDIEECNKDEGADWNYTNALTSILHAARAYQAMQWQPIESCPKGDNDYFLVCSDNPDDDRQPFGVRGDIFQGMRKSSTPKHLSLHHITHWMPHTPKPIGEIPELEAKKLKGWMIPGMGFIDFKEPVTFDEAKLAMEVMVKSFDKPAAPSTQVTK